MKTPRDLTGQTFGRWTALYPAPSDKNGPRTTVQCWCGQRTTVQNGSLMSGRSTKCRVCGTREDLTGSMIADMKVVTIAPGGNWTCECQWCLRKFVVSYRQLLAWRRKPPREKCAHLAL